MVVVIGKMDFLFMGYDEGMVFFEDVVGFFVVEVSFYVGFV